jgi:deoxyribodipyrimidine photo-lyase
VEGGADRLPDRRRRDAAAALGVDWRLGAAHFLEWLVDGDIANNQMNWQWVVGTGTKTRRTQPLNPCRQADRFDRDGDYVRRYVPELAGVQGRNVHRPWTLPDDERRALDLPRADRRGAGR